MAPRLTKQRGKDIDEILQNDFNISYKELAIKFSCTVRAIQSRAKGIKEREMWGDARKRTGERLKVTPEVQDYALWLL